MDNREQLIAQSATNAGISINVARGIINQYELLVLNSVVVGESVTTLLGKYSRVLARGYARRGSPKMPPKYRVAFSVSNNLKEQLSNLKVPKAMQLGTKGRKLPPSKT